MKNLILFLTLAFLFATPLLSQTEKPRLAVVIVCDQLAEELLLKYQPYFGDDGFNKLIRYGAYFTNARYQYAYTKTGPGHACVSTGAYSNLTGIAGNSWYDRTKKKTVGCVDDDSVQLVGREGSGRSPRNLLTYTIGDMLKLSTAFRSKVISVSNKDRSAIFLGGKFGSAYWTEGPSFVTSTYYRKTLPDWVQKFNGSGTIDSYFGKRWELLKPELAQILCDSDSNSYESDNVGLGGTFPHPITGKDQTMRTESYYWALDNTPYGAEYLLKFASEAIVAESLGSRGVTDMLCIGISSTDIVGHEYGAHSYEAFDNLLRIDMFLAEFFSFLEKQLGLYNCVIGLTADHAIAPIPEYIQKYEPKTDVGRIGTKRVKEVAERCLTNTFGAPSGKWIENVAETNIYLNPAAVKEKSLVFEDVLQTLKDSLIASLPVFTAFTEEDLMKHAFPELLRSKVELAYFPQRSGDLMYILKPYWILDGSPTGTNHGSPWDYDAHIPLLIFGKDVVPGTYAVEAAPVDLVPTLAALLGIEFPPSRQGKVLKEALR